MLTDTSLIPQRLKEAKVKLLLRHPFYAALLLKWPLVANHDLPTAAIDGERIYYNPAFFESLTLAEAMGVLCHEIMHMAFLHCFRQGNRENVRWNYACDFAINSLLIEQGFKLPEGALLHDQFNGKSAEAIYELLKSKPLPVPPIALAWQPSDLLPSHLSPQKRKELTKQVEADLVGAATLAKLAGKLPGGMEKLLIEMQQSTLDWRRILAGFLTSFSKDDYSYQRLQPSYLQRGLLVPTLASAGKGVFVVAIDTSGSIYADKGLLQQFINEVTGVLDLSANELILLYCDAKINHVEYLTPEDAFHPREVVGGGGTDFAPVIKWLEESELEPSALLYFTDGFCHSYGECPAYPVMWVVNNPGFTPPFGEVLYFNPSQ